MKESSSLHLKVQELCDCFATTDPLQEMAKIVGDKDPEEAALKWLALAVLHGINYNAENISLRYDKEKGVTVVAKYRKTELPTPGTAIGEKVLEAVRGITHIDNPKGKTALAFGFRNNSLELEVSMQEKKGEKRITIEFPE
jgi:hypothetical protein